MIDKIINTIKNYGLQNNIDVLSDQEKAEMESEIDYLEKLKNQEVILVLYGGGDCYYVVRSDGDLTTAMRNLWEDKYNECLGVGMSISEEDTWFEEDQAQIVGISGEYIAEYRILKVREV